MNKPTLLIFTCLILGLAFSSAEAKEVSLQESTYNPGVLKPIDSSLQVEVGQMAPDFTLKSISGRLVTLSKYRGRSKVVLSFVPAAWTPVCSAQWPGYNISEKLFRQYDAVLLGITVDNIPTLHVWVKQMGSLWFDVLSDFWPHGGVAKRYGVLRSDGTAERALVYIDKEGVIRAIDVSDINVRPPLEDIVATLQSME